ncbi:MAG: sulfatase-like hydrolase/transferase, partial [Luteolibacter sp.]
MQKKHTLVETLAHSIRALLAVLVGQGASASPPNLVVIVADDLGFADVGYHGSEEILTPNIDSIAAQGVHFLQGYSNGSVCTPTRAALLTGRYQNRLGCDNTIAPYRRNPQATVGLPTDARTIAERLKPLGYATGMIGKWHLGGELEENRSLMPPSRGFDEFYGILEGAALYLDRHNDERKYRRGYLPVEGERDYYTDAIGRESVSFIRRHKDGPFLCYVPFTAPHAPLQAKEEHLRKFRHIEPLKRRKLVAMVHSLDENVGRILDALKSEGLERSTLVAFLSDNGGKPDDNGSLNTPLRGEKTQFFEGGIRVPFCMKWPGTIPSGQKYASPVIGMDLFPTLSHAAGGRVDPDWQIDGVDLLPYLLGKKDGSPHDALYWRSNTDFAVQHDGWKLVRDKNRSYLFHLAEDPNETKDLL